MKNLVFRLLIMIVTFGLSYYLVKVISIYGNADALPIVEAIQPADSLFLRVPDVSSENNDPAVSDYSSESFSGWYSLDRYTGMPEVNMILIHREVDSDTGKMNRALSGGGVFTTFEDDGDQGFIDDRWSKVSTTKAKFRTKIIKGFEYRFDGRFFKNKTSGEDDEKILRGTLQKFKGSKKVAEVSGDFAYHEPHCRH